MRWLFLTHRYLGIAIGLLMAAWCVSGVVMMYVRYPELSSGERLRHLEPVNWGNCCVVSEAALADEVRLDAFQVEMVGDRPVLRLHPTSGKVRLIDLHEGDAIAGLSARRAEAVAAVFSKAGAYPGRPRLETKIDSDQWTVSGEFNRQRPLFRFALDDPRATQFYVSGTTGKVVQVTTGEERFWNWLGAIPHWLYFSGLRRDTAVWSQVVIWTSLIGCFLTLTGLYIGVRQFLRQPRGSWSPYRGVLLWHHVPGSIFGVFALTWVASGLISMNPWGFLDSDSREPAARRLQGEPLTGAQVKACLRSLPAVARLPEIVSIESAPLLGQLYLVVTTQQGVRWRFDAAGASARIGSADWTKVVHTLSGQDLRGPDFLAEGDNYYFRRRGDDAPLPVYRVVVNDSQRTRYYLDPLTATLVASFDGNARWYRWLHQGLHTLDFAPVLRARPAWDLLMLALLSGVTAISIVGAYLGVRHLHRARWRAR